MEVATFSRLSNPDSHSQYLSNSYFPPSIEESQRRPGCLGHWKTSGGESIPRRRTEKRWEIHKQQLRTLPHLSLLLFITFIHHFFAMGSLEQLTIVFSKKQTYIYIKTSIFKNLKHNSIIIIIYIIYLHPTHAKGSLIVKSQRSDE